MQNTMILIFTTMRTSYFILFIINTQDMSFIFTKNFTNYVTSNLNFNPDFLNMMFRAVVDTGLWVLRVKVIRVCSDLAAENLTQEATYIAQVKYRSSNNIELKIFNRSSA